MSLITSVYPHKLRGFRQHHTCSFHARLGAYTSLLVRRKIMASANSAFILPLFSRMTRRRAENTRSTDTCVVGSADTTRHAGCTMAGKSVIASSMLVTRTRPIRSMELMAKITQTEHRTVYLNASEASLKKGIERSTEHFLWKVGDLYCLIVWAELLLRRIYFKYNHRNMKNNT